MNEVVQVHNDFEMTVSGHISHSSSKFLHNLDMLRVQADQQANTKIIYSSHVFFLKPLIIKIFECYS